MNMSVLVCVFVRARACACVSVRRVSPRTRMFAL
jgi:hypothetical protein